MPAVVVTRTCEQCKQPYSCSSRQSVMLCADCRQKRKREQAQQYAIRSIVAEQRLQDALTVNSSYRDFAEDEDRFVERMTHRDGGPPFGPPYGFSSLGDVWMSNAILAGKKINLQAMRSPPAMRERHKVLEPWCILEQLISRR